MSEDLIPIKHLSSIKKLGYENSLTFCKVFNWFREEWGYTSWIEKTGKEYNYKIYARGVYHRPIHSITRYPYYKTYDEAKNKLLNELIIIVQEIEK